MFFSVEDFLDRAKSGAGVSSDYALAKVSGLGKGNISNYRNGRSAPDGKAIVALCELSGDDPEHVAACIQALRAPTDADAALWRRVAERLRVAGAATVPGIVALAALLCALTTDEVQAAPDVLAGQSLLIMSTVVFGRLAYRLARLARHHAHHAAQ